MVGLLLVSIVKEVLLKRFLLVGSLWTTFHNLNWLILLTTIEDVACSLKEMNFST